MADSSGRRVEEVGAYGKSVTIYPKEHLVIAVNLVSVDHHGMASRDGIAAKEKALRGPAC